MPPSFYTAYDVMYYLVRVARVVRVVSRQPWITQVFDWNY